MTPQPPIGSVSGIEALIVFGLQIFAQIFALFRHPTQPVPVSAAPQLINALQATPGLTADHQAVIATQVNAAVAAHQAG